MSHLDILNEPAEQEDMGIALHAMDDWDVDLFELFGLADPVPFEANASASHSTREKRSASSVGTSRPYSRRPSSLKLRKEELEKEVENLQQVIKQLKTHVPNDEVSSNESHALRVECEAMAARQRKQRLDAEIVNGKLRALLELRYKDARKIAVLTRKLGTLEVVLGANSKASITSYRGPVADIAHQLLQLNLLFANATTIFSDANFSRHSSEDVRNLQFRECAPDGIEAQFLMSWKLPFPVDKVAAALWIQTTRMKRANRSMDFEDLYSDSNVLVSRFVMEPRGRGCDSDHSDAPESGITHGQIATRLETGGSDGSVVIVSTVDAKVFMPSGRLRGSMKGDGYLRATPISDQLSCIQWCRNIRGFPPESTCKSKEARMRWIHDIMTGPARQIWLRNLDSNVQAIENMLLTWSETPAREEAV